MNASELKIGESREIIGFSDDVLSLKLIEMGCLPGNQISLNYIAPLGDPVCVHVEGYDLSLRKSEAASIIIQ